MSISGYTQLQNWSAGQAAINKQMYGGIGSTTDFSTAFGNAQINSASQQTSLTVTAMQLRQVQKAQSAAKSSASTTANGASAALTAAKAAGTDILRALGLMSAPQTNTKPSSSSGPYVPPTNPATGHAYVATSAAGVGEVGALNILA